MGKEYIIMKKNHIVYVMQRNNYIVVGGYLLTAFRRDEKEFWFKELGRKDYKKCRKAVTNYNNKNTDEKKGEKC